MTYWTLALLIALANPLHPARTHGAEAAPADSAAAAINACSLLGPAEISDVIALPVAGGLRNDSGRETDGVYAGAYSSTCLWVIEPQDAEPADPAAPHGGQRFVILHAMQWPEGSGLAHTFLEAFHEAASIGEIPSEPSPREIGDEALWWGDGLAVRSGDVSFGLSVFLPGGNPDYPGAFEERLASHILRRLENPATRSR